MKQESPTPQASASPASDPKQEVKQEVKVEPMQLDFGQGAVDMLIAGAKGVSVEGFYETAYEVGKQVLTHYGGPWQFLQAEYPESRADEFQALLVKHFNCDRGDVVFATALPDNDTEVFLLRPWDLSWFQDSSTKPAPYLNTSLSLWDEVLKNTFLTAHDPLILWNGPPVQGRTSGWTHFVKGAARAAIALFCTALAMRAEWDLRVLAPALWESLVQISCRRVMSVDLTSICFQNAQSSARGNIRRAHDVATWLAKLSMLQSRGLKADSILKQWNEVATKESQIGGQKRVALLALLAAPTEVAQLLVRHSSEFGSQSAFSEECFAQKQLQIGYTARGLNKAWSGRLVMTPASLILMCQFVDEGHRRQLSELRGKLSKDTMQEAAAMAQLVLSVETELREQGIVTKAVSKAFLNGDMNLQLELQLALSEKSAQFKIMQLSCVSQLLKEHDAGQSVKFAAAQSKHHVLAGELEKEEFTLMEQMVRHDVKSYDNYLAKLEDHEAAVYHADLQFRMARQQESVRQARSLSTEGSPRWMIAQSVLGTAAQTMTAIQGRLKRLADTYKIDPGQIFVLPVLNWTAPSMISSDHQKAQATVMGALVNNQSEGRTLGLVFSPAHCYTKGGLWKQEEACNKMLAGSQCNLDTTFVLPFQSKADDRDRRCLVRNGRVVTPLLDDQTHAKVWAAWRSSVLVSKGLLSEAQLISNKDYRLIEDPDTDSVPDSTNITGAVGAAEKWAQLGEHGFGSVLRGALSGLAGATKPVVVVIDLFAHTADLCLATIAEAYKPSMGGLHLYYLGFHSSDIEAGVAASRKFSVCV